ncbi:CLUMA_CG010119, isoform A [Clunio marinus]|uniref:CLUMA_CG010119, isoform A n=1 Tax=Clunio marinus TaxID=568069 RepID=A0A1J1I8N7_9DIPT|nr:CLUMA_CG010119, isoform A [Clunio marinus]
MADLIFSAGYNSNNVWHLTVLTFLQTNLDVFFMDIQLMMSTSYLGKLDKRNFPTDPILTEKRKKQKATNNLENTFRSNNFKK